MVKEIAEETLCVIVPSMLLQPLIENSIKHGLEPRIGGGTVTLRSRIVEGMLLIEVEDDGVGVEPGGSTTAPLSGLVREGSGIGMRNVAGTHAGVVWGRCAGGDGEPAGARDEGSAADAADAARGWRWIADDAAETVKLGLGTVEEQRQRFAKMGTVGRRDG